MKGIQSYFTSNSLKRTSESFVNGNIATFSTENKKPKLENANEDKSHNSDPSNNLDTNVKFLNQETSGSEQWGPFSHIENDWKAALLSEVNKPYFQKLTEFVDNEYKTKTVYPPINQIFTAFNLCELNNVKVKY